MHSPDPPPTITTMILLQFQGLLCHVSLEFFVADIAGKPYFDFGHGITEAICDCYIIIPNHT